MKTSLALLAGACYSAAYVTPYPIWAWALVVSIVLVTIMRVF